MKLLLSSLLLALTSFALLSADSFKLKFSQKDFDTAEQLPNEWHLRGKLFLKKPNYKIVKDKEGQEVLRVYVDHSSGTILHDITGILQKYPIMRWKWRVLSLPKGADGRIPEKDDQVIAIYVGVGIVSTNSRAYRWETETPKGHTGNARYGAGMVKVKWTCVRNKTDGLNQWHIDEVNAAEDLKEICGGKLPTKDVAVSISSNSQYTKSRASAELEYIEFLPLNKAGAKK